MNLRPVTVILSPLVLLLVFSFSCLGDVEIPPEAPSILNLESPTRRPVQTISGEKPANCAVLLNDQEIIKANADTNWSAELSLVVGENAIDLLSQRPSGLKSVRHTRATIVYEPNFPAQPSIDSFLNPTNTLSQEISGDKDPGSALILSSLSDSGEILNSQDLVAADAQDRWSASLQLQNTEQAQRFSLIAQDARGQFSEPYDFTVVFDITAASIVSRSPTENETDVPSAAWISVAFDEALDLDPDNPPTSALRLFDSQDNPLSGNLSYQPHSHALLFQADTMLSGQQYRVDVDPTKLPDLAGNLSSIHSGWSWHFTCGDSVDQTPGTPTVELPPEVIAAGHAEQEMIHLHGTKDVNTSLWINNMAVVALNEQNSWQADFPLQIGENTLHVVARSRTGLTSPETSIDIERVLIRPATPTLDPAPPAQTDLNYVILEGQREANTSIVIGDRVVVPRSPDTSWAYNLPLDPGANEIIIYARNADAVLSEPLVVNIDYRQNFTGPVPADFRLQVDLDLRNLSTVQPIASNLGGRTHYAVDAWLEGPLEAGETCQFDTASKERKNIHYAATMVHYIGNKPNRTNPFWDVDYRAADYLASLVSGGVFSSLGISSEADRRNDSTGHRGGDLVDGSGRVRLSTSDLINNIDGVTEATTMPGNKHIDWFPLRADGERLPQGEYLLFISLNLDRDAGWVVSNDFETCWDSAADHNRGTHRIVQHVILGADSFRLALGPEVEASGEDIENGADKLHFLGSDGLVIRWGNGI